MTHRFDTLRELFDEIEVGDRLHVVTEDEVGVVTTEREFDVIEFDEDEWTIPQGGDDDPDQAHGLCRVGSENRLTDPDNPNKARILCFDNGHLHVKTCPHRADDGVFDFSPDWLSDNVVGVYDETRGAWAGEEMPDALPDEARRQAERRDDHFPPGGPSFGGGGRR